MKRPNKNDYLTTNQFEYNDRLNEYYDELEKYVDWLERYLDFGEMKINYAPLVDREVNRIEPPE